MTVALTRIARALLALTTLGAIADSIGMGAYVAAMMLPLLLLAAWRSGVLMALFWTLLAVPCGLLLGFVTMDPYSETDEWAFQLTTAAVFLLTLFHRPRGPIRVHVDHRSGG